MSADTLVFDMSSQSEGSPEVFVKKDWLSILDNQNQSYIGNQSVIDTSQLANSNKYMNYREAYLSVPLLLTLTNTTTTNATAWTTTATSADYVMGLRNWYGSVIHSFTIDYNGTTIVQQTPYCSMWNTFKLMTSLSLGDLQSQGAKIGFFPDTATSVQYNNANTGYLSGTGTVHNQNFFTAPTVSGAFSQGTETNEGFFKRQLVWAFDPQGASGEATSTYADLISVANLQLAYKSYIFNKKAGTTGAGAVNGVIQVAITATIMLKHIHSFFERVPLLKGVFMKMTMNLNQSSVTFNYVNGTGFNTVSVQSPLGGVSPLMIASGVASNGSATLTTNTYIASIAVGGRVLNTTQTSLGVAPSNGVLSQSIQLIVPAYTYNPVFETAYLSSPIKKIVYTDIYQYQIVNQISTNQTFNNLITNGIANIKSVLVLPFYQATGTTSASTGNYGLIPYQSPFEGTGSGTTSPFCYLGNFNIQVSGQNQIYNTEKFTYEQFNNQLYGYNAVNGGMTDGLTSGLVGLQEFESCYNYYWVDCGRMLPVEQSVPKSVNVIGQNFSGKDINLFVFIEYGVEVSVDILTGARV
jgi:hypothetical protein